MKRLIYIFLIIIVFEGCSDKNEPTPQCNAENPLEMEWIKDWVAELQFCACTISVFQAEYNGEPVFWQLMNDPLCQSIIENISVFNCSGEEIQVLNTYQDWVDFNEDVTERKIIYVCPKN